MHRTSTLTLKIGESRNTTPLLVNRLVVNKLLVNRFVVNKLVSNRLLSNRLLPTDAVAHTATRRVSTKYNSSYTGVGYAHADGGSSNPGYLTMKSLMGDVNLDGSVDVRDMAKVLESILKGTTAELPETADLNNDNVVDVRDMAAILKLILGN